MCAVGEVHVQTFFEHWHHIHLYFCTAGTQRPVELALALLVKSQRPQKLQFMLATAPGMGCLSCRTPPQG